MSTGLITTYSSNPNLEYIEIKDESLVPAGSTGLFVSNADYNIGCFYCSVGKEIRASQYRDNSLPACCIFHNLTQTASEQYVNQQITVNNNEYVTNLVTNQVTEIINPPPGTMPAPDSAAATILELQNSVSSLTLNYNTLMSKENSDIFIGQQNTWNNSQAISVLQNTVSNLVSVLKSLTILSISTGSFKNNIQ